jgi:hypothetical protein
MFGPLLRIRIQIWSDPDLFGRINSDTVLKNHISTFFGVWKSHEYYTYHCRLTFLFILLIFGHIYAKQYASKNVARKFIKIRIKNQIWSKIVRIRNTSWSYAWRSKQFSFCLILD